MFNEGILYISYRKYIKHFQIFKYCPIIKNHTSMESLFIQLSCDEYI